VTLAGLEPAPPAPENKDALSPLSYSVVTIFITVCGGAGAQYFKLHHDRARRCPPAASRRRGQFETRGDTLEHPGQQRIRSIGGRGVLCVPTAHQTNGIIGVSPESA
jgi:hypothetical protein